MIYTFYSYKGGVGRSMAMANLAKWFYMHGLRVVIIDWDLEAPGLENFFFDPELKEGQTQIRRAQDRPGVIDLLIRYQRRFPALPIPPWSKTLIKVLDSMSTHWAHELPQDVHPKQFLKILDQLLPPSLRPGFDAIDTSCALNILKEYLPSALSGLSTKRDDAINILENSLPQTLTVPFEQVNASTLIKAMEDIWAATPLLPPTETSNEPDVSALLSVIRENLLKAADICFDKAYVGPLLQSIQPALPEVLNVPHENTDTPTRVDTAKVMDAFRTNLPPAFILQLRNEYAQSLLTVLGDNLPAFSTMLFPIYPEANSDNGDRTPPSHGSDDDRPPGLWLFSAGWRYDERFPIYARNVQTFNWTDFYNSYQGEAYFEWMRNQLNSFADVILIDSRTGVTEMGGVCTRQLADVVVSFVAPNGQNLTGVATMVESFQRQEVGEARKKWDHSATAVYGPEVVVIPARVETSEVDLRGQFEARFLREINNPPDSFTKVNTSFWDLKIPYVPYFSYNERIVMDVAIGAKGRSEELETAYKKLALHLAMLAPERTPIRKQFAKDLSEAFPNLLPGMTLIACTEGNRSRADSLCAELEAAGISVAGVAALPQGRPAEQEFIRKLDLSASVVLAASATDATSDAVLRQLRLARQYGKCVYVVLDRNDDKPDASLDLSKLRTTEVFTRSTDMKRLVEKLRIPCRVTRIPQMAPPLPDFFFAHGDALARLKEMILGLDLNSPPRSHADVAVCGLGGTGKTVLATALCYDEDVLNFFPGGILWVNLGPNAVVSDELNRIYTALTGALSPFDNDELLAAELAGRLMDQNCLMAVDDVWNKSDLQPFIKARANCAMLITTRNQGLATDIANKQILIEPIALSDGVQMITASLPSKEADEHSRSELEHLVNGLGRLPLAIELAGAQLRRRTEQGEPVGSAAQSLRESLNVHGVVAFDRPDSDDRNTSITRSLELSLRQFTDEERELLETLAKYEGVPLHRISDWRLDSTNTERLIEKLSYASLIKFDRRYNAVLVHPLVASYLLNETKPRETEPRPTGESVDVKQARDFLRGKSADIDDLFDLAMRLKNARQFGLARRLLVKVREHRQFRDRWSRRVRAIQQLSLCTRRDPDLPIDERLRLSFEILQEIGEDLNETKDQETLGLAGAIFKERWALDGQKQHLERSLAYYMRGYNAGVTSDYGYTSINAAYVLDLLADQEAREAELAGFTSQIAQDRRNRAESIRQEIVEMLPRLPHEKDRDGNSQNFLLKQWWFLVTVGEAFLGLRRYEQALYWLKEAAALPNVPSWEYESTARQLVNIARLKDEISDTSDPGELKESKIWEVLRLFLQNDLDAVRSSFIGKVGLALSGGGFRASLFHIGVLAKLAELDVLRKVEVLSCVSGGSIIGAHYYLEVRKLLKSKPDAELNREDYIKIVHRIEEDFLAGVQRNIRMRVAANPLTNLKLIFVPNYSRTERVGELYEREIFSRATGDDNPIVFEDLIIQPFDGPQNFVPRSDNWRRANKVPVLILNATTLNTGHNWQFTASWMGEPPNNINTEVDGNDRLRRLYYHQAPAPHNKVRLGHAVAASACVPGLFEPLALSNLYRKNTVRLVDGGVHDNQGVGGLLSEDCSVMLVSDASGQMATLNNPSAGSFGVPLRSNAILQSRVREAEYRELSARRRSSLLRGLMFIHLKKDLQVDPVNWIGCDDPDDNFDDLHTADRRGTITPYGVRKDIQQNLSGIRTDLDSFSEKEAYALMLSGYRMTGRELPLCVEGFAASDQQEQWRFLGVEKQMDRAKGFEDAHQELMRALAVGSSRALKVWKLSPLIPAVALLGLLLPIFGFFFLYTKFPGLKQVVTLFVRNVILVINATGDLIQKLGDSALTVLSSPLGAVMSTVFVMALLFVGYKVVQLINKRKPFGQIAIGLVMASVGWFFATIHLLIFDRLYLQQGRIENKPR